MPILIRLCLFSVSIAIGKMAFAYASEDELDDLVSDAWYCYHLLPDVEMDQHPEEYVDMLYDLMPQDLNTLIKAEVEQLIEWAEDYCLGIPTEEQFELLQQVAEEVRANYEAEESSSVMEEIIVTAKRLVEAGYHLVPNEYQYHWGGDELDLLKAKFFEFFDLVHPPPTLHAGVCPTSDSHFGF